MEARSKGLKFANGLTKRNGGKANPFCREDGGWRWSEPPIVKKGQRCGTFAVASGANKEIRRNWNEQDASNSWTFPLKQL